MNLTVALSSAVFCLAVTLLPPFSSQSSVVAPHTSKTITVDSLSKWEAMSRTERKDYMREVVQPKMQEIFAAYDEQEYGNLKCKTCHGSGDRTGEFKMPDPKLSRLPKSKAGLKALTNQAPRAMQFMSEIVVPEMAALLGINPNDPRKKFGCGNCHTTQK